MPNGSTTEPVTSRLSSAFAKPRPALVCFLTAGDGDTAANLDALAKSVDTLGFDR